MACNKTTYSTKKKAEQALKQIFINGVLNEKEKRKKTPNRVYKCEHCEQWHLTSKTRKQYKENKHIGELKAIDKKVRESEEFEEKLTKKKRIRIR